MMFTSLWRCSRGRSIHLRQWLMTFFAHDSPPSIFSDQIGLVLRYMHVTVHFCNSIDDVGFRSFYNFCGFFFRYSRLGGDLSTSCWLQIDYSC